jgi:hypothetical protein
MPRIGQLLSALLVVLIGILVVQMLSRAKPVTWLIDALETKPT